MKKKANNNGSKMLKEYDFSKGIRGKYVKRLKKGSNIIVLDSDVAKIFKDEKSVNQALRALAKIFQIFKK